MNQSQRNKTCCFTGHRKLPFWERRRLAAKLEQTVEGLVQSGILYFGTGGALGFDTLAAQAVLKLRKVHPQIKLILVLPCRTQTQGWKRKDIKTYKTIKAAADKIRYISEEYTRACMYQRNRHLVEYSSVCVCYLTQHTGGTAYTVKYAKSQGCNVINLAEPGH